MIARRCRTAIHPPPDLPPVQGRSANGPRMFEDRVPGPAGDQSRKESSHRRSRPVVFSGHSSIGT